ncbi:MAG: hypothetical protein K0Q48_3497 [Bacillota bacterium]|nr:hypothetical protein [Bacillota bacterium]
MLVYPLSTISVFRCWAQRAIPVLISQSMLLLATTWPNGRMPIGKIDGRARVLQAEVFFRETCNSGRRSFRIYTKARIIIRKRNEFTTFHECFGCVPSMIEWVRPSHVNEVIAIC